MHKKPDWEWSCLLEAKLLSNWGRLYFALSIISFKSSRNTCHSAPKIIFFIYIDTSASKLLHWLLSGKSYLIVDLLPGSLSLSVKAWNSLISFHLEPFSSFIPLPHMSYAWKWFAALLHQSLTFISFNLLKIQFCQLPQSRPRRNLLLRLLSVMLSHFMFLQLQAQLGFNLDWHLWAPQNTYKWEDGYFFFFFS